MIDHLPIERLRLVDDLKFWRVVQWTTGPVALGVASAVAMTAQPFISQTMHMPFVGAWSVAVAIPLVSGLASHMAIEHGGLRGVGYATAAVLCAVLSGATIINSKEFNEQATLTARTDTANVTATSQVAAAQSLQVKILDLKAQAQQTYEASIARCSGKNKTACTNAASKLFAEESEKLQAQYNEASAHKPAVTNAPAPEVELSLYDYTLAAVPDVFAGILSFAFFYARRRVVQCLAGLKKAVQPTVQQPLDKRGPLQEAKARLGADLRANTLPPIAVAVDGQIIVSRLATHYKLHSATVKKLLAGSTSVVHTNGRFYIKTTAAKLAVIRGDKWH